MKQGFCTMGYLDYTTVEEAIRRIAKIGYEAIDFWAYSPHLCPKNYDAAGRERIKKQCADAGLEIAALSVNGGGLALEMNFSHSHDWVRKETLDYYLSCIGLAADIGCPFINWISGHVMFGTTREQAWEWNRDGLKQVVARAAERNVTVAIHTLTWCESRVVVTLDDALQMMREIDHPNCKVMIDTADQNITDPNLSDAIRKAGRDLVYVHTNDNSGLGQGDVHLPPGRGNIDWDNFFSVLQEIGYDGNATVQVHTGHPIDIDSWAKESKAYLEPIIAKYYG